jgi:hypothetical protein
MSNEQDLLNLMDLLQSIPTDQVRIPSMPMETYIQEAYNLNHWIIDDRSLLINAGLSEELIDSLPARINACRDAQARWTKERIQQHDTQVLWKGKSPFAYQMRNRLLRAFRFAFRNEQDLLNVVADITKGATHADMIQDLVTLSVLGRDNIPLLEAIHFDINLLDEANQLATEMGDLLAEYNGERLSGNKGRILRDQAYTYLKEAVDEIRKCGKYVFADKEQRLNGYYSPYIRRRGANYRHKKEELNQQS